jgi:predicted ATPase/DNA-binding CsgD family transcriptional regulator
VHGFPAALTSFIGRDEPLREVAGLLQGHRLVTVTGPGGSGKTRLAGEVARRAAGRFADGAWLVELALAQDPAQVAGVVATALGVREQSGIPAAEMVARVLARQQLLLVLDNCEHVIGGAARLCAELLAACDDVRVLATSREPLRTAGEARYRLWPLTLPGSGGTGGGGSEAVTLFADRARRVDPRFALDEQAAAAVARLVTRLDGMPLAIELAAARVESLGLAQLLDRIDDRFELLEGGDRMAPSRQRSLAATVEWSYQLLDESGQRVFRALSVFPGPFTLEAAEAVAGQDAAAAVLWLVDCSLLVPPQNGPDGRARYGMLETLRAYGARLLAAAGERDAADAALASWALEVAIQAEPELWSGTAEVGSVRWLDAEDAVMRQVLAWAMRQDVEVALRLAEALEFYWFLRGLRPRLYPQLAELARYATPGSDRHRVWQQAGWAALWASDPAEALELFTTLRDAVADRPPCRALADALVGRSASLRALGRVSQALEEGRRCLTVVREVGFPLVEVVTLAHLAMAAAAAGDVDEAVLLARQMDHFTGRVPPSIARSCSGVLAEILIEAGDFAGAERICAAVVAACRSVGDLFNLLSLLSQMTMLDLRAGRTGDAAAHLRESLQLALRAGSWDESYLDSCGHLCAATGRHAEAVTAWAARAALVSVGDDWPGDARHRQEPLRAARQALGPERVRAAEERGAAMSWAAAAEYTMMLTEDPGPVPAPAAPGLGALSVRERQLVTLVAQGRTNAQMAAELFISVRTVGSHLDRIRDKTGCRRRADLTRLALTAGLV